MFLNSLCKVFIVVVKVVSVSVANSKIYVIPWIETLLKTDHKTVLKSEPNISILINLVRATKNTSDGFINCSEIPEKLWNIEHNAKKNHLYSH